MCTTIQYGYVISLFITSPYSVCIITSEIGRPYVKDESVDTPHAPHTLLMRPTLPQVIRYSFHTPSHIPIHAH